MVTLIVAKCKFGQREILQYLNKSLSLTDLEFVAVFIIYRYTKFNTITCLVSWRHETYC
jgi:hypothetical protein